MGETGIDPELAAPLAPEIDLYAHENLGGFDMEAEENLGGVELAPNVFSWANANADGFDPEGLGPPDEDVEIVSDSEEESEPSEVEGSSGMDSLSISSFSASAIGQPHMEVVDENSVDQLPPPKVGNAAPAVPVVPPGKILMIVNQHMLQAAMARLGISTAELGIYPYGG